MRLQELTIYSQYFRFVLEDNKAIAENTASPFGPVVTGVMYDNERQTVICSCSNDMPCEHKVFIHEFISKEKESTLFRFLNDCREESAQTITPETLNRIRGAFAREYNLAKGVVQYPERREPLDWVGSVPGVGGSMRAIEFTIRTPGFFVVYELGEKDEWGKVMGVSNPVCQSEKCKDRSAPCKHEQAVALAVRDWREKGLLPKSQISGKKADTVIMDDLTMVEKAEPILRTGKAEGGWMTVPAGFDGTYKLYNTAVEPASDYLRERVERLAREELQKRWESAIWGDGSATTASANTVGIDPAKFKEDINKAKELLEKKEKPKPEKPAKPRTRFTDLEL